MKPLHTFLLLTEKPGEWAPWLIAPWPLVLSAVAGMVWARTAADPGWGWAVALGLLVLFLADWLLFALLPRWSVSFGAVQPPFLALTLLRWALAMVAAIGGQRWPVASLAGMAFLQCLICVLAMYGTLVEPFRLQIGRLELPIPGTANPGSPVQIVQLSDLHVERLTRRERALPALVAGLAPDLLLVTGDFLSTSYNDDPRALADLRTLLAQFHAPGGVYAIWGTAEVDLPHVLRPLLDELGIVVLEDEAVELSCGHLKLWLVGLRCTRDLDAAGATLRALMADAPPDALTLLLFHTPDLMPQAADAGVDLYLAGHTHGGQWRLPGFGALITSSRYWKRYEAGHYQEGKTHLYVSRGLGMEGFGAPRARFFCPPEVVSVTLTGPHASLAGSERIQVWGSSADAHGD